MPVPAAAGTPQYSGNYIPEIWSGKILTKFYASTVLAAISNTDYEGELKNQGDTIHIRTTPDVMSRKYTKNSSLIIERPESPKVTMQINRARYWNTEVDDIDAFQSDINLMEQWAVDAAKSMAIAWDTEALGEIYVDADAFNKGATAGKISRNINMGVAGTPVSVGNSGSPTWTPVDFIIALSQILDEQNVPDSDRFAVLPAWMIQKLKTSDLKMAYLTGDDKSPIRNGLVGMVDRMTIYSSNLLAVVDDVAASARCYRVIAGQKSALSFASQFTKNETIRAESTFGTLMRGLQVADWKVLKPEALIAPYIKQV